MSKLANKLTFSYEGELECEYIEIIKSFPLGTIQEKGKRPLEQGGTLPTIEKKKVKKLKLSKEPAVQVLKHFSPNIMIIKGETTTTQSIIDHYSYLNTQMKMDNESKLKSSSTPQLISALDKEKHMLKVVVIQPSKAKDVSEDKVTEFKFNMNKFNVSDKVDLFKQTSELICLDLISTSVSQDRLQRYYKKLENNLKYETTEKKALQIKNTDLEKKVLEISKGSANDALHKAISKKEAEIQSLKKKLKLPHDSHVEIAKLKIVLEEKQNLESELQNTKAMVGTIQGQKEELE